MYNSSSKKGIKHKKGQFIQAFPLYNQTSAVANIIPQSSASSSKPADDGGVT